jgi:HK97 family phage major capsid protein
MLSGLSGLLRMPRQTAASSSSWLAENSPVSNTDMNFDDVLMSPKRLSIQGSYTIELLAQTSLAIEDMLRMDQATVLALSIDFASIAGSGTPPVPLGLLNQSGLSAILTGTTRNQTTGVVTAGLGAVAHTWNDIIAYETAIAKANADTATMGWLFTPEVRGALKATAMFPAGLANPIWPTTANRDPNGLEEGPLGYKAGVTNQLPKNLTFTPAGGSLTSNLHAAIFGDWSSMLIADWGVKEVVVDNITQAAKGVYIITENSLHDTNVRHIEKFAASQCVLGI